jgi:hypothetical protein
MYFYILLLSLLLTIQAVFYVFIIINNRLDTYSALSLFNSLFISCIINFLITIIILDKIK